MTRISNHVVEPQRVTPSISAGSALVGIAGYVRGALLLCLGFAIGIGIRLVTG